VASCRSYSLPLKDSSGRKWEFVIKSWANGTEHRRVYVLEQVSEYIKAKHLHEEDAIGICADEQGILSIEVGRLRCWAGSKHLSQSRAL
jgi:hypothetical protein